MTQKPKVNEMTDRELLELAAKAAAIKYDPEASKPHPKSGAFFGLWLVYHREPTANDRRYWNPLTNDGDALRLAVKLLIAIDPCDPWCDGASATIVLNGDSVDIREPQDGDDLVAATRRAIVRAAAEIGKGME